MLCSDTQTYVQKHKYINFSIIKTGMNFDIRQTQKELADICRKYKIQPYDALNYLAQTRLQEAYNVWSVTEKRFNESLETMLCMAKQEKTLSAQMMTYPPNSQQWNLLKQQIYDIIHTPLSVNIEDMKNAQLRLRRAHESIKNENIKKQYDVIFKDGYFPDIWKDLV